jgi:uncharacterized protein YndB with AHSA1/START domain
MSSFADHAVSPAPPEEVWKLLYDPLRFPEWWAGMERVELGPEPGAYTYWYQDYPDLALPQRLVPRRDGAAVTISCLESAMEFEWRLSEDGGGTRIDVTAAIPEDQVAKEDQVRAVIGASVRRLATVAATDVPRAPG